MRYQPERAARAPQKSLQSCMIYTEKPSCVIVCMCCISECLHVLYCTSYQYVTHGDFSVNVMAESGAISVNHRCPCGVSWLMLQALLAGTVMHSLL